MKKNITRNRQGFTLIEVLVTLAISTMFIGLVSTVLVTSFKHQEVTQSHIDLRQEANLVVTKLRQAHQEDPYQLCVENNRIYFDSSKTNSLTSEQIAIKGGDVLINKLDDREEVINAASNQCVAFDSDGPLLVNLILEDEKNGNEFDIDTVIGRSNGETKYTQPSPPIDEDDFSDFLINNNVFLFANKLVLEAGSNDLAGGTSSVFIREEVLTTSNSVNNVIKAEHIYVDNYYYTKQASFRKEGPEPGEVSDFKIPVMPELKLFNVHNYLYEENNIYKLGDIMISKDLTNAIVVTETGNINISKENNDNANGIDVEGILFAPNGEVIIGNQATFKGIIIADKISIKNADVSYSNETLMTNKDILPFK